MVDRVRQDVLDTVTAMTEVFGLDDLPYPEVVALEVQRALKQKRNGNQKGYEEIVGELNTRIMGSAM